MTRVATFVSFARFCLLSLLPDSVILVILVVLARSRTPLQGTVFCHSLRGIITFAAFITFARNLLSRYKLEYISAHVLHSP